MSFPHFHRTEKTSHSARASNRWRVRLSVTIALALVVTGGLAVSLLVHGVYAQSGSNMHPNNPVLASSANGWGMIDGGSGSRVAVNGNSSAKYAFKVNLSDSSAEIYTPQDTVKGGSNYTFAVDSHGSGTVKMGVDWYDASGGFLGEDVASGVSISPSKWTKVAGSFTAPSAAVNANVAVFLSGGSGNWYVTNASYSNGGSASGGLNGPCATSKVDNGFDVETINVRGTATYVVWTRMRGSDSNEKGILMQVDGNHCYHVGGKTLPSNKWTWVNYQNGDTSNIIKIKLDKGSHHIKYIGTDFGTLVDRTILTSNQSCVPSGTGDDCATGDATPPNVVITAPDNDANLHGTVTVKATASDKKSGVKEVDFKIDGNVVKKDTSSPYSYSWNTKTASSGSHTIKAEATDGADNTGSAQAVTVTVNNKQAGCSANPSTPGNLKASGATRTSVTLTWSASKAASHCTLSGYHVYRNGTKVQDVTGGTTFTDKNLNPDTQYHYTVEAYDSNGHKSGQSHKVTVKTSGDSQAPTVPAKLKATMTTANQATLEWQASTDNVKVAGYEVFRDGQQVGTAADTTYTDQHLQPSTSYKYTVKAVDTSGNESATSNELTLKTLKGTGQNDGDSNGDGTVNKQDLVQLLAAFLHQLNNIFGASSGSTAGSGNNGNTDYNSDGQTNINDLSILLSHWQQNVNGGNFFDRIFNIF